MAARVIFVDKKTGQRFYKINIQMYFNVGMIGKLSELSGKSEKYIIDELIFHCQNALMLYGLGGDGDPKYVFIDENDNSVRFTTNYNSRHYLTEIKDDVMYNLVDNITR